MAIINIQLEKNTNQCKDARELKEPEGCRVDAPQQLNQLCYCPVSTRGGAYCGKELLDDQHSCAGGAGLQPVSLGGWVAQIRKDLDVAEKV